MSPHDARRIEKQTIAVAQCMVVTSRRRGWTQETRCCSHLEQTRPTRRVVTLIWSRQAFEVLLIGSGDGSSRISASACERWQRGVSYTTTGLSHDPRTLVVLGCRGGGSDRPQTAAEKRGALGYVFEKTDPLVNTSSCPKYNTDTEYSEYHSHKKIRSSFFT